MCPPLFERMKERAEEYGRRVKDRLGIPPNVSIRPARWPARGPGRKPFHGVKITIKR